MLKTLLKADLQSFFAKRTTKRKIKLPRWLEYLLIGILLAASFYGVFYIMAMSFVEQGFSWLFFSNLGIVLTAFGLIEFCVIGASKLYDSKYNDVILAMPVKPVTILNSRLLSMYLFEYVSSLCMTVSALIAYFQFGVFSVGVIFRTLLVALFLPILPMILGILLGLVIKKLTRKVKYPNLIKTVLTVGFVVVYYYFSFSSSSLMEDLLYRSSEMADSLSTVAYLVWIGKGITEGRWLYILYIAAVNAVIGVLAYVIIERTFLKTLTAGEGGYKKEYVEKSLTAHGLYTTLLYREFKHIGSVFIYLINTVFGIIMMAMACLGVLFYKRNIMDLVAEMHIDPAVAMHFICAFVLVGISFCLATHMVSSVSISIEGRNLETLKALPIDSLTIINSKLLFHYLLAGPLVLISTIAFIAVYRPGLLDSIIVILFPQCFLVFTDITGLWYNMRHPRLDWGNEAEVVKRGFSVFLSMVTGMLLSFGIPFIYFYIVFIKEHQFIGFSEYAFIWSVVLLIVTCLEYDLMIRKGTGILDNLG
ncbi:MAG: hypothetical protein II161_07290 [Erysipelotrichaceae bacterium]|nr:hypothetical protein [Erysipelotrichaceae bacterium]